MFTLKRRPLPYHWVRHIKTPEWLDPVLGRNACLHFPLKLSCFRGSQTYGSASETLHSLFSHWRSRDYGAGSQRGMYDRERAIVRRKNYATCFMQKNEKPSSAYNNPKLLNKLVIQKKKQILYKRPIGEKYNSTALVSQHILVERYSGLDHSWLRCCASSWIFAFRAVCFLRSGSALILPNPTNKLHCDVN